MIICNYITTNLLNNKQYIGTHVTDNIDDKYLGSGKLMLKAISKYSRENFKKDILCICNTIEEGFTNEEKYIKEFNTLSPSGYNISPTGGMKFFGRHSEETKQRLRKPKGPISDTHRENLSKAHIGQKAWSKGKKLSPLSQDCKDKISKSLKGCTPWNKGKKTPRETVEKIRKHLLGRHPSEETKRKISESNKLTKNKNASL
jgi:hypothetical protein